MLQQANGPQPLLHYTIMCEDVRLEISHRLSLMGVFQVVQVPQLPITMIKMAVLNHWSGEGNYLSEVRILTPDRAHPIAVSPPSQIEVPGDGFADNVTIFTNLTFPVAGNYVVQTLINSNLFAEQVLIIALAEQAQPVVSTDTIQ
jgi:hypothetical protein